MKTYKIRGKNRVRRIKKVRKGKVRKTGRFPYQWQVVPMRTVISLSGFLGARP